MPKIGKEELLAQIGSAADALRSPMAEKLLTDQLTLCGEALRFLVSEPSLAEDIAIALLIEGQRSLANGIVHAVQAVLAARGEDEGMGQRLYGRRSDLGEQGNTLHTCS